MSARDIATVDQRLAEAVAIGRRIQAIRAQTGLWSLSEAAWRRQAMELGDFVRSLPDSWATLERYPHLRAAIEVRARLWCDQRQDRPAVYVFGGERDPVVHAEMMAVGWGVEALSALCALRCADMRDPASWGEADNLDPCDGDLMLQPHVGELAELDRELHRLLTFGQATCSAGRWAISHGGITVELDGGTIRRLASEFAERVAVPVIEPEAAAA